LKRSGLFAVLATLICLGVLVGSACNQSAKNVEEATAEVAAVDTSANIIFLHHSTGNCIWKGGVPEWFASFNTQNGTSYEIIERSFPSGKPYAWKNYPFDYWNIWVKNAGPEPFMKEPTLEMLTKDYNVIIFKHCYPVAQILEDTGSPDIASEDKTIENFKLQYAALKEKFAQYPDVKFIVWTGAALTEGRTTPENAQRAVEFFSWVKSEWDQPGDNIFLWDLWALETGGGPYLKLEYAEGESNPHPNDAFSKMAAPKFAQRIVDVIQGKVD